MNDSILRGFCECGIPVRFNFETNEWEHAFGDTSINMRMLIPHGEIKPTPVLSPKQMRIVYESDEYRKFIDDNHPKYRMGIYPDSFIVFFEHEPFLVASILKDAGEKSKEENK